MWQSFFLPCSSRATLSISFSFLSDPSISLHIELRIHLSGFMILIESDRRAPYYYGMCQLRESTQWWKIHWEMTKLIRIFCDKWWAKCFPVNFFVHAGSYFDKIWRHWHRDIRYSKCFDRFRFNVSVVAAFHAKNLKYSFIF